MSDKAKVLFSGCAVALGLAAAAHTVLAFGLAGRRWATAEIPVALQLGDARALSDGSADWDACARQALEAWNVVLAPTAHRLIARQADPRSSVALDGVNSVAFSEDVFGMPFAPSVLSLTSSFGFGREGIVETMETDVLVNQAHRFDCFRGPTAPSSPPHDLQRTVSHALGHVLGLAHPEPARQQGPALMRALVGDVETLQLSDIQGALTLAGADMVGIPFPPRNETLVFYQSLETEYRNTLQRDRVNQGFVDAEGSAVWFPEWLRYVLNACSAEEATTRVLMQIRGEGIQPVCAEVAAGVTAFPPRNQSLDFLQALDTFYRDELKRGIELSYVDLEGKAVWLSEYLRLRIEGASGVSARAQVFLQIRDAAGIPGDGTQPVDACAVVRQLGQTPGIIDGQVCSEMGSAVVELDLLDAAGEPAGLCTGTVIAPTAVLTAAHCLAGDIAGARVRTAVGTVDAASIHPIPSYRDEEPGSLDVGVIITTENLALPSFPILTSRSATAGEAGVIAGYGVDRSGRDGVLQAGTVTVDRIDSDFIYTIFEGVGSNTCSGDSGGPLFVQEAGTWVIAGVTSGGDTADCLSGSNDFANLRHAEIMGHVLGLVPAAEQR